MTEQVGKYMVVAGILLSIAGLLLWLSPGTVKWFGHLPGDIRIEKPGFKFFAPLGSMLLLSILFSLVLWVIRKISG